jgi:pilus assembly protein CpaC
MNAPAKRKLEQARRSVAWPMAVAGGLVALCSLLILSSVRAQDRAALPELEMFAGETRVLPAPHTGRLAVGNGSALSAAVLDDREILLIANQPGVSSLHIWTKDGRNRRLKVQVLAGETARVTREILQFLRTMPAVSARAIGDKIIVEGENLRDEERARIETLAKSYPQIVNFTGQMGWEKMIHMDVRVVEIARDKLRDLGIKWASDAQGPTLAVVGDLKHNDRFVPVGEVKGEQAMRERHPVIAPFKGYFGIATELTSRLRLLEQRGDAITLAEPQLSARSGSKAEFQVGGEVPYAATSPLGQTTMVFKNYGVILHVSPTADSTGAIRSRIKAEVSEPDAALVSSTGVPGLRMRRTETEFNVRDGETMVLSGIINRRNGETHDKLPGLGDVPVLGALFRSKRFVHNETELLIFVTPRVVTADDAQLTERRRDVERRSAPPDRPEHRPARELEKDEP